MHFLVMADGKHMGAEDKPLLILACFHGLCTPDRGAFTYQTEIGRQVFSPQTRPRSVGSYLGSTASSGP